MGILARIIQYFYKQKPSHIEDYASTETKEKSSDEKVFAELTEMLEPCLNKDHINKEIRPSHRFEDILRDSLAGVELIVYLEERYKIRIPNADIQKCETVEQAVKYLHNALQTKCA